MKIVTQDMCAISIIEGGALRRDGGAETPRRWCYFSVQVVLRRRNSHTALEMAYYWSERHEEKDDYIENLKISIKKAIKEFVANNPGVDPNNETTLSSCFGYLSFTLKQRINTLYNENKEIIDIIASRNGTPNVCLETIKSFVDLRNGKTHSGIFAWNENAKLFYPLFTLVYACLLNYIGVDDETVKEIITCVF